MSAWPSVTLRYFACRGRVQYLRYFLRLKGIPFTDERVPLSAGFAEWIAMKPDASRTGPFRKLPVLQWGEQLIAETPVIHDWLQRKTGDAAKLPEDQQLRHAMLASSCASDLMLPLGLLLYSDLAYPGTDIDKEAKTALPRIRLHLKTLDQALHDWDWHRQLHARGTMLADCFLWDMLDFAHSLFGPALELQSLSALAQHYTQCPGIDVFRALQDEHPGLPFTARPGEAEAMARVRAAVN